MVQRDPIEPGPNRRFTPKLVDLLEHFQKDVVRGILSQRRVPEQAQGNIINTPGMLLIKGRKIRRQSAGRLFTGSGLQWRLFGGAWAMHNLLDSTTRESSRPKSYRTCRSRG